MKKLLILYLFSTSFLFSKIEVKPTIISIPKCGTHLLQKCINLITKRKNPLNWFHVKYSDSQAKWFFDNGYNKLFFIYRDPRDQIISLIHHVNGRIKLEMNKKNREKYRPLLIYENLTINQKINKLISEGGNYFDFYSKNSESTNGIYQYYNQFEGWKKQKDICLVSFEDLIGPKGGGNLEKQIKAIRKISKHLNINLSSLEINKIAENLFGSDWVFFRKGQIGDWKNYFNHENINNFKLYTADLLIKWGYEKNLNWEK